MCPSDGDLWELWWGNNFPGKAKYLVHKYYKVHQLNNIDYISMTKSKP